MKEFVFDLQLFADISNGDDNTLVSGTSGNDSIENDSSNVTINGGAGNDAINSSARNVEINSGAGHDSLYVWADSSIITSGEGNDYFRGVNSNVTLKTGTGDDTVYCDRHYGFSNSLINTDSGDDYIKSEHSDRTSINCGAGNDYVYNYGVHVTGYRLEKKYKRGQSLFERNGCYGLRRRSRHFKSRNFQRLHVGT